MITYFNAGSEVTFPLFVWGAARAGLRRKLTLSVQLSSSSLLSLMVVNVLYQRRRERQTA